ncbi:hypothetical protein TeGR_g11138 [Tetraparma gracilis]|uniref:Uncharacterized protein n=1 Tax=Tetraparma gracilis TaxID=2962635 RepID=A0ABQ6N683_9STRA|nr:hypothetical protein TeGR_g11138 [Tetraparma gracilis]
MLMLPIPPLSAGARAQLETLAAELPPAPPPPGAPLPPVYHLPAASLFSIYPFLAPRSLLAFLLSSRFMLATSLMPAFRGLLVSALPPLPPLPAASLLPLLALVPSPSCCASTASAPCISLPALRPLCSACWAQRDPLCTRAHAFARFLLTAAQIDTLASVAVEGTGLPEHGEIGKAHRALRLNEAAQLAARVHAAKGGVESERESRRAAALARPDGGVRTAVLRPVQPNYLLLNQELGESGVLWSQKEKYGVWKWG